MFKEKLITLFVSTVKRNVRLDSDIEVILEVVQIIVKSQYIVAEIVSKCDNWAQDGNYTCGEDNLTEQVWQILCVVVFGERRKFNNSFSNLFSVDEKSKRLRTSRIGFFFCFVLDRRGWDR